MPLPVHHRTATIDGLEVFYREAGDPKAPAVVLLHGFPTSSHMFRHLIPALADRYHVIAPDHRIIYEYTALDPSGHVANTLAALQRWKAEQK